MLQTTKDMEKNLGEKVVLSRLSIPKSMKPKLKKYQATALLNENKQLTTIPDTIIEILNQALKDY